MATEAAMVHRYRCASCGNLTRFQVTVMRRSREYHHFTTSGELEIEEPELLEETFQQVECRWCGPSGQVVEITHDPGMDPL